MEQNMRTYEYYLYDDNNEYGQPTLSEETQGQIKMAINISSQATQDNILFKDCSYIGLTRAEVDDTYVIKYGNERLKVLYINPKGRYKQVFLKEM